MSNAFERHGIDHLSASQINLFTNEPAMWCFEKLLGYRGHMGAAAVRGIAAEEGVLHGLLHSDDVADCVALAEKSFDHQMGIRPDPGKEKQRAAIAGCVEQGLTALQPFGEPDFSGEGQSRIEIRLEGVPVPFVGYLDFIWPKRSLVVDLKTTLRLPSKMSASHQRQRALYQAAHPYKAVQFLYVTPKTHGFLEDGDHGQIITEITATAVAMERFLSLSDDAETLTRATVPNFESFYWSRDQIEDAKRVWEIGGQIAKGSDVPEPSQISW